MKYIRVIILIFITTCSLKGQQGTVYNLYFHDHYYLNPAAAGSQGLSVFNIAAKEFWLGFPENTPGAQALVFHTRIKNFGLNRNQGNYGRRGKEGRVGFGTMFYNDIFDPVRKTGIVFTYAYHIRLNKTNLSFGLSSNTYQKNVNKNEILLKNPGDPLLEELDYYYSTDANFGTYIRSQDYYFNFVVNNLTESRVKFKNSEGIRDSLSREYNIFTGYFYKFNPRLMFEPSFLFQVEEKEIGNTRMDINMKWIYNDRFWTGIGISSKKSTRSMNAFVGIKSEQFDFGYSFQIPFQSNLLQYSIGAHEVMFSLKFGHDRFNRYHRFYR